MTVSTGPGKYRLLRGKHHVKTGHDHDGDGSVFKTYEKGQIIDSKEDLSLLNGRGPTMKKFEWLGPGEHSPPGKDYATPYASLSGGSVAVLDDPDEQLNSLTIKQLRQVADDESIDLTGLTRKDDIVEAIQKARAVDDAEGDEPEETNLLDEGEEAEDDEE